ncbi:bi-functional transferase/deacetylase [Streptomyces litmocidini]|uniref:bifunctional polysaccharide deacetylase/glycosyltransferase family 2 protein n=1 Tax=Streptomyces litmocidini TaxID=67318 RepID=UPI0019A7AE54|nr:bifunctional polysaccharide deacetylase/glycosyltransferase family 2 protein [Streptomyces litmocidini]GGU73304.1 bi-functional transferase/deacetylase [Streptomyces litmocidini]
MTGAGYGYDPTDPYGQGSGHAYGHTGAGAPGHGQAYEAPEPYPYPYEPYAGPAPEPYPGSAPDPYAGAGSSVQPGPYGEHEGYAAGTGPFGGPEAHAGAEPYAGAEPHAEYVPDPPHDAPVAPPARVAAPTPPGGPRTRHALRRDPRAHWAMLCLVLLVAATALVFAGYGRHEIAATGAPQAHCPTAPETRGEGPVVQVGQDGTVRSATPPDGTVALTYDGGPSPDWTPRLLDVLAAHHAKATFFLTGSEAAAHPDLVRRIVVDGHELGSHTYTDVDLAQVSDTRADLELSFTQNALGASTGLGTRLLRLPHTTTLATFCTGQWEAGRRAAESGYVLVAADGRSVLQFTGSPQAVDETEKLLAHPSGATRHTSVGQALGLTGATYDVSAFAEWKGAAFVQAQNASRGFADAMTWLLVVAGVITAVRLALLLGVARVHVRRTRSRRRRGAPRMPPVTGPVSILVPAYNEEAGIEATVRSLLASTYEAIQVVVIDDGSSDRTFEIAESIDDPRVMVVRQPNAGKAAALNTGLAWAHHDIIVMIDGDTVFEPDAVRRLVQPLADPRVGAVSGNTKVGNRQGVLGRWQHLEYVIGFNLDRRMYDVLECMPTVPGAIGAFRRDALAGVGGVSEDTLAEDTDLTMALCRAGWRVVYEESAIAWTEAPSTVRQLWKQRYRWCYGTLQAMWKHRRAVVEGGQSGKLGRRGLLYLLVFQTVLPLLAPLVDVFAVYGLLFQDPGQALGVWLGFTAVQVGTAVYALRLDRERFEPIWTLPLQIVVYRQLMYLVVVQSVVTALLGSRLRWHRMQRTGTATETLERTAVVSR